MAILMAHGHNPEDVADYAWADVQAFMTVLPYLNHPRFGGGRF